ncbi:hypothetical protein Hanom_Chr14g01309351 [Helianthus anomalus]
MHICLERVYNYKCEFQVLSFIYISCFSRCPLSLKLMTFVLIVSRSCMVCPLSLTQLILNVK